MNKILTISKPKIVYLTDKVQLEAIVKTDSFEKKMWFRYDKKYAHFLVDDRLDAFCIGILYYAMFNNYDIRLEAKISERLYYQLTTYFIPSLAKTVDLFHEIKIFAETTTEVFTNNNGVATGISGGVDSFYTLIKYTETKQKNYKLTHVIFSDIPLQKYTSSEKNKWLLDNMSQLKKISSDFNLDLIYVECNIVTDFLIGIHFSKDVGLFQDEGLFSLKFCSIVMSLGKLLNKYYFSSGFSFDEYNMKPKPYDTAYYDLLNLNCIETEYLVFYSVGGECCRLDKVKYIANFPIVQDKLLVCGIFNENCGHCNKCLRTMSELYAIGKLDLFKRVFPVDNFKNNLSFRLASILSRKNNKFEKNIIKEMNKNNIGIPIISYLLAPIYRFLNYVCSIARKYTCLRKIYYTLNLDVIRFGRKTKRKDVLK